MKKGSKLTEDGYLLEITDLDGNGLDNAATFNSLRKAVAHATERVPGMDAYLKVYRDFTAMQGAYVAVFLEPNKNPNAKPQHTLVKIRAFEVYTAAGIRVELDWIERISKNERIPRAPRSVSSSHS